MRILPISILLFAFLLSGCVSKKKLNQSENKLMQTESRLSKEKDEKKECEIAKEELEETVKSYNEKINSLQRDNKNKIEVTENGTAVSEKSKEGMRRVLKNVDQEKLAHAKTLEDSINLAVAYNIKQNLQGSFAEGDAENGEQSANLDGLDVDVSHPIVKITINNSVLFKSGSFWVNASAHSLIGKLADLINSEPNMEVLVEGHTDSQKIVKDSYLENNWVLGSKRAISVVKLLQEKYDVSGEQLIASSRSSHKPIAENDSAEGRKKNRRTTITLMPNMEKFMAMLEE
ncbi:MAG: OmpA/MotB family protein [Bacteroidota bacterium]